jgi:hypothetical protein
MLDHISVASIRKIPSPPYTPDAGLDSERPTRRRKQRSINPAASASPRGNMVYLASVGVIAMAMAGLFFGASYTLLAARGGGTSLSSGLRQPDPQAFVFPTVALAPSPAAGSNAAPDRETPAAASPAVEALPSLPSSNPILSAAEMSELLKHGDDLLQIGDIASARLFYERAAIAGNGRAALRLGATFDPAFLERAGLRNLKGDVAAARSWYSRALDLGLAEAKRQLDTLENRQGR